ncbi:glycosyltransferase family 2 protein [Chromohalobacter sp. 296-RDG]|uniref:glycosyltransferase family 2 protein n=1 Tax=Chromohalobacter sp. 296-RDG TaxID=2994062 RepID=UPI002469A072|nr:glycosyltransferase family 2 protein [Chromohalobacter sp. 296-RDG]
MTDVPLVSVIIPMHGRSHFIEAALRSVIAQTHPRVETILVDDNGEGSANQLATHEQVAPFLGPNVRYSRNPANVGVSATRNRGVELARREYITFLDDDDLYYEHKVAHQLQHMQDHKLDISICSFDRFDADSESQPASAIQPRLTCAQHLFFNEPSPHAPTIMIERAFFQRIGGFNESLAYREDLMLVIQALSHGAAIGSIQQTLFNHRVHPGFRLSKKRFACDKIGRIFAIIDEEEAELRRQLRPAERERLLSARRYKQLDALFKNGCRIPFSLLADTMKHTLKTGDRKRLLRSISKYVRAALRRNKRQAP